MKALICITTSSRSLAIKSFAWDYIAYCQSHPEYDFLISLDGDDKETIKFCERHKIPLIYSKEREGVGLSKNRVLSTYPDYDHYFFIEDDVGLLDARVFDLHIQAAKELNIHHMSLFPEERISQRVKDIALTNGQHVIGAWFGGAPFNYFTKNGIETVGGFHTCFAKYRRFGHTEHSYRFVNAGLAEYPFYVIRECLNGYLAWNDPVSVTKIKVDTVNRLFVEEHALIEQKLAHFPLTTLAPYRSPDRIDISGIKKPIFTELYRLLFRAYMFALFTYRLLKKITSNKYDK